MLREEPRRNFFLAVLDGLDLQRALPSEAAVLKVKTSVLMGAIAAFVRIIVW